MVEHIVETLPTPATTLTLVCVVELDWSPHRTYGRFNIDLFL